MTFTERTQALLQTLSEQTGGKGVVYNDGNVAHIWLSGMLFVFVAGDADEEGREDLMCIVYIAALPDHNDETLHMLLLRLLQSNHAWNNTGGGILGLDAETGFVCLSLLLDPQTETGEGFLAKIACIYQISLEWRSQLIAEGSGISASLLGRTS